MRLAELNPRYGSTNGEQTHIIFTCPKCKQHEMAIPFAGEQKWEKTGDDFTNMTLSPSILYKAPAHNCESHFFIRNGEIVNA
jgi:hypothetical protein